MLQYSSSYSSACGTSFTVAYFYLAKDCLSYMQEGTELTKLKSNGRLYKRYYWVADDLSEIRWMPTSKKYNKAKSKSIIALPFTSCITLHVMRVWKLYIYFMEEWVAMSSVLSSGGSLNSAMIDITVWYRSSPLNKNSWGGAAYSYLLTLSRVRLTLMFCRCWTSMTGIECWYAEYRVQHHGEAQCSKYYHWCCCCVLQSQLLYRELLLATRDALTGRADTQKYPPPSQLCLVSG